ncbi:MAG: substrate-binding domain-containing protein, partial [Microbacterium sp.]
MRAISSMATRHVLTALADAAVTAGLPPISIESVGGVDAARRVAAGEPFDLVFLAADALTALGAEGHVDPASIVPLMLSQTAVAVASGTDAAATSPAGAAFPDAAGLREALR